MSLKRRNFWSAARVASLLPPGWLVDEHETIVRRQRNAEIRKVRAADYSNRDDKITPECFAIHENGYTIEADGWGELLHRIWCVEITAAGGTNVEPIMGRERDNYLRF